MGVWGPGIDQNDYGLDLVDEVGRANGSLEPLSRALDAIINTPMDEKVDAYHVYEGLSGAKLLLDVGSLPGNVVTLDRRYGREVPTEMLDKAAEAVDRILSEIDHHASSWRDPNSGQEWVANIRELRSQLPDQPAIAPGR